MLYTSDTRRAHSPRPLAVRRSAARRTAWSRALIQGAALLLALLLLSGAVGQAGRATSLTAAPAEARPALGEARTVTYRYDAAGRLTQATYGDQRILYTYRPGGQLLRRAVVDMAPPLYLPLIVKG